MKMTFLHHVLDEVCEVSTHYVSHYMKVKNSRHNTTLLVDSEWLLMQEQMECDRCVHEGAHSYVMEMTFLHHGDDIPTSWR